MICDFDYCIYSKDGNCTLRDIEINELGMCDSCSIVLLAPDFLDKRKTEQREAIALRWKKTSEV